MYNQHPQGSQLETTLTQESNINWQTVGNKKRTKRSPEMPTTNKRQLNIKDYWLNKPISVSNSYEKLNEIEDKESSSENCGTN